MGIILIFAEHHEGKLTKPTQIAITAAKQAATHSSGTCEAVIVGKGIAAVAQELAEYGLKVHLVDDSAFEHYLADAYAAAVVHVAKATSAEVILGTSTAIGKDLLPRVAALLDAGMATDVTEFSADGTMQRPIFAGNVLATVAIEGSPKVVSVRATAFDAAAKQGSGSIASVDFVPDRSQTRSSFIGFNETKSDRPVLTDAKIVVSGGRALKSGENFKTVLEPLVDALGAAMGASRAAVDAGYVPNDLQVGQTGKVVAPSLYIAVGISGAIQHLAGMKDSKIIVAINKDAEAPIFQVADYGLVADLFKAVPEMTEEVKKLRAS